MRFLSDEQGFWSAYVLIFIVTLALMGMGSAMLIRNEGMAVSKSAQRIQADYAAESGVYFGIEALKDGTLSEDEPYLSFDFNNSYCYIMLEEYEGQKYLRVESVYGDASSTIVLDVSTGSFADKVIVAAGSISSVIAYNESGSIDNTLLVPNADVPQFDKAALMFISSTNSNDQFAATWTVSADYKAGFFRAGIEPNVTYVQGNMVVANNVTVHGIFVVEGSVTLNAGSNVQGVIWVCNNNTTTMNKYLFSSVRVNGGIITQGEVVGSGFGSVKVQQNKVYMQTMALYQVGGGADVTVGTWEYQ